MSEETVRGLAALADLPVAVRPCPIAASLGLVGERWALLAIREIGYGVRRFDRIVGFTGASRDILTDRLRKLEAARVVERRQYSKHPPRFEYHLTESGLELFPVLLALSRWGDRWALEQPVVAYRHACGHELEVAQVCTHCHQQATPDSITPEPRA